MNQTVQIEITLTVSASKRLIAKGVVNYPKIKHALKNGKIIITRGSTNAYIAEELLGNTLDKPAFILGKTLSPVSNRKFPSSILKEIVLEKGTVSNKSFEEALEDLNENDVVIKGANALDYSTKQALILVGHPEGGTIGKVYPKIVARKATLLIPIGLEKLVATPLNKISTILREPVNTIKGDRYSAFIVSGDIFTEIEALKTLADVDTFHVASGGICGAEGAVRMVIRGEEREIEKISRYLDNIIYEPPL